MSSSGGGQQKSSTTTTNSAPWTAQQPYIKNLFTAAQGLEMNADGTPKAKPYYPNSTYAGMAPESAQALEGIAGRANAGSPITRGADQFGADVLSGKYLDQGNPYFQGVADKARDAVNANYAKAGRTNSGYHDEAVASSVGQLAYNDYQNQLGLMNNVAQYSPQLAAADYADSDRLNAVGQARQGEAQNLTNADIQRFNYEQQAPEAALQAYQDFISGSYGGSTSSVQPYYQQPGWQTGLGYGLAGLGALGSFF